MRDIDEYKGFGLPVYATGVRDLTESETQRGLKDALIQGASAAVGRLGRTDGFLKNKKANVQMVRVFID